MRMGFERQAALRLHERVECVCADDVCRKFRRARSDCRDIRALDEEEIPDHDVLVAGFPASRFRLPA